ncbi:MAG: hypothetical protein KDB07_06110 [Planctomycetes bacterium]|nr:hypothetical protein [Planctomycetota bacterium]
MRGPIVVTITDVWSEVFRNSPLKKLVVGFQETKPLILNKTNIRRLANIFKTGDTARWRGPVTLYLEGEVQYAGQIVGGIRVKPVELPVQPPAVPASQPVVPVTQPAAQYEPPQPQLEEPRPQPIAVNGAAHIPPIEADLY